MNRTIWTVYTPDEQTLTVIAESGTDATELAMEFCDDADGDPGAYPAHPSTEPPTFWRWVAFSSAADAEQQIRELHQAGADIGRTRRRASCAVGRPVDLWEIGATDADWCRLPSGYLCGGDE